MEASTCISAKGSPMGSGGAPKTLERTLIRPIMKRLRFCRPKATNFTLFRKGIIRLADTMFSTLKKPMMDNGLYPLMLDTQ